MRKRTRKLVTSLDSSCEVRILFMRKQDRNLQNRNFERRSMATQAMKSTQNAMQKAENKIMNFSPDLGKGSKLTCTSQSCKLSALPGNKK